MRSLLFPHDRYPSTIRAHRPYAVIATSRTRRPSGSTFPGDRATLQHTEPVAPNAH
ncbi:hypothetical protein [Microlunatus parietis]|uniref:Uncharacterized protein n=1 Tax=Microlunatus parietis TaxID=682979 RepID=A0A7Y9I813_9ACTN|nr:hypothetical protein [Microlunatus parietis]NYE72009.1 hypothetical protein [Microlunatus parietis]